MRERCYNLKSLNRLSVSRKGLSLLEVMLALVILGIAVAILAQALQVAANSGVRSKEMVAAQVICESKMAEVVSGLVPAQSLTWTPISIRSSPIQWHYMIETIASEQPDMLGVQVMVTDDPNRTALQRNDFRLMRWIIDPSLGLDAPAGSGGDASGGGSANGTAAGGSASGGSAGRSSAGSAGGGLQ